MSNLSLKLSGFIACLLLFSCFASAQEDYRPLLIKNAAYLGITTTDAAEAVITHAYTDKASRITYIYLQQSYRQIKVYNTIITAAFIDSSLQYTSGIFVKNIADKAGSPSYSKSYIDAVRGAAHHLHLNEAAQLTIAKDRFASEKKYMVTADAIARRPVETTLYWTASGDQQKITLTWNVNIQVKDSADWWNVRINAQTGEFVQKDNWTVSEQMPDLSQKNTASQTIDISGPGSAFNTAKSANVTSAVYRVIPYPYESPIHAPFVNETSPWLKAGADNNATTLGWHFDNFSNYNHTRGNNVFAFLDRRVNNTPDAVRNWPDTSTTPAPDLTFIHIRDTTQQPWLHTENKKAALDNLFYWNNLMHDVSYQYGFTEAAGNFQRDNLGRGGTGNDYVMAHAQDSAGYNNAWFTVPPDGSSGIMQMYNWITAGIYMDSDFDNGLICHEYGHGISCRLTGGPYGAGCLNNAEQPGEGWSDYFALMMTTNWETARLSDGTNLRAIGTYAAGQSPGGRGIRRYYYSTSMAVNGLTYAHMASNTEVHATGEIWCSAIWDMTWNIIQQQNAITPDIYNSSASGGNIIAMNLVITGMKLQPCSPGFLDARNAILAADSILYGYSHKCAIWSAFARRGMGYSARQGSTYSATDQTAAFDLPPGIIVTKLSPVVMEANADYTFTRTVTCNCQPGTFTLTDTIPAGFTYVSSAPAGILNGNVLTFPATAFAPAESRDFAITLHAPATGCIIDSVLNDNRETTTTGGFMSSGSSSWAPSTVSAHSGNTAWYAPNLYVTSTAYLTSASTTTTTAQPLSILSFWHNFRIEPLYDGGVVEYSGDGGATWTDAAPLILNNGYNNTMAAGILFGRRSFSGNSTGFKQTTLNLASLGTTPVQFRFRMETTNGVGVEGWYVDDIVRANGCGGIMRSAVYDATGLRLDSAAVPVFVHPLQLPLMTWSAASLHKNEKPLMLVPNPVNNVAVLYISNELKATSVKIYNASGSLVWQMVIGAGVQQVKIPTNKLAAGVYIIETTGVNRRTIRMLVQH